MRNDRLALCAVIVALALALVLLLTGCALLRQSTARDDLRAVEVSRVPIVREELPLPELPEAFNAIQVAPNDNAEAAQMKKDIAEIVAQIERLKAETAAAIYAIEQNAKITQEAAQKEKDIALAAQEEKGKQAIYPAREWLGAIIAAAIACVVYAYKRLNLIAAALGLLCFAGLFCLVFAGQHYGQYLPFAPLIVCPLMLYAAHRAGVLRAALVACVRGVEFADDDRTKAQIKEQPDAKKIEIVRKDIDAATVAAAKANKRKGDGR